MTKETIKNPDIEFGLRYWEDFSPKLSHFDVHHDNTLVSTENPIINNLIAGGWDVHRTRTEFFMGFPAGSFTLKNHFLAQVRDEYQVQLESDGFLRFRFEQSDTIYLTLFYIHPSKQGRGLGRKWFKPVTDALFRAGVCSMRGAVSESYYPARKPMDPNHLTRFYVREAGFVSLGDSYIVKKSPFQVNEKPLAQSPRIAEPQLVA